MSSVWSNLVDQQKVVETLQTAVAAARQIFPLTEHSSSPDSAILASKLGLQAMSHSWLFTGPAGSGRSIAARDLAAALQCTNPGKPGCGECQPCRTVISNNHPDVLDIETDTVMMTIKEVAELVDKAQQTPSVGRFRIIILQDADRMAERTSNLLLKAIEEPPPHTVWMLCTPQPQDVLNTIRSRCRIITLKTPNPEKIALHLQENYGLEYEKSLDAARFFHSHYGKVKDFVSHEELLEQRQRHLRYVFESRNISEAMLNAEEILANFKGESIFHSQAAATKKTKKKAGVKNKTAGTSETAIETPYERQLSEAKKALAAKLGLADSEKIPREYRAMFKQLEEDHKRKEKRAIVDDIDRLFMDIYGVLRDIYICQLGAEVPLLNRDFSDTIKEIAENTVVDSTFARIEALAQATKRLKANVSPILVLQAVLLKFVN